MLKEPVSLEERRHSSIATLTRQDQTFAKQIIDLSFLLPPLFMRQSISWFGANLEKWQLSPISMVCPMALMVIAAESKWPASRCMTLNHSNSWFSPVSRCITYTRKVCAWLLQRCFVCIWIATVCPWCELRLMKLRVSCWASIRSHPGWRRLPGLGVMGINEVTANTGGHLTRDCEPV